jgi:hypothetical protein
MKKAMTEKIFKILLQSFTKPLVMSNNVLFQKMEKYASADGNYVPTYKSI